MPLRPKTKQRLGILIGLLILCGAALTPLYLYREHEIRRQTGVLRTNGLEAYRKHDWNQAIANLDTYVKRRQAAGEATEPDAMLGLAISHMERTGADQEDLADAIAMLRRYLELAPANADARHRLLKLLVVSRQWDQVIAMSRKALEMNPNDTEALSELSGALGATSKFSEALEPAERYNDVMPTDLDGQELTYNIMRQLKTPLGEMMDRARHFEDRYPADPRFKLAEVLAYVIGKDSAGDMGASTQPAVLAAQLDDQETRALIDATAHVQPPDAQFVRLAIRLLENIRRYQDSLDLLARAQSSLAGDVSVKLMYVQRLWQVGQDARALALLDDIGGGQTGTDAGLVAFKALALRDTGQAQQADALVTALAARQDDADALAWAKTLQAAAEPDLHKRVAALLGAVEASPTNGVAHYYLAESFETAKEDDLALEQARAAAYDMPGWCRPHLMIARLDARRFNLAEAAVESDHALAAAKAALGGNRTDDSPLVNEVIAARAVIFYEVIQARHDEAAMKTLLAQLGDFRQAHRGEQRTLGVYVRLLLDTGQTDAAKQTIDTAVAAAATGQEQQTLLELADISATNHLGMEDAIYEAAERKFGLTPQLAFDRARQMVYRDGKNINDARAYLHDSASSGKGQPWEWGVAEARFLEDAKHSDAAGAWAKVGETYSTELAVQSDIVNPAIAASAWRQRRAFVGATIDRVRGLTGEWAVGWRLAKARWLLDDPNIANTSEANEASVLLSDALKHPGVSERAEPHVLQSRAMEKLNNLDGAVAEMSRGWLIAPGDSELGFELVRLYHAAGRYPEAAEAFDRLAGMAVSLEVAEKAALLMYEQHDLNRAGDLLRKYDDPTKSNDGLVGLLAMVDQRLGRVKEAGDLFLRLADSNDLPPIVISSAADFFASIGDKLTAQRFLNKLDSARLAGWERLLKRAAYLERYGGDLKQVDQLYQQALTTNLTAPAVAYVGFLIRQQRLPEAITRADAALKVWPGIPALLNLKSLAIALQTPSAKDLTPVAAELSVEPESPAVASLLAAMGAGETADELLGALLKKYPDFYPGYEIMVHRLIGQQRPDSQTRAAQLAEEAMARFPDQPLAARLACVAEAETGHWTQSLAAAQQWRQRDYQSPVEADWHIALCLVNLGRAGEAVNRLEPYVVDAKAQADDPTNQQLLRTYLAALIAAGRVADAQGMIEPLARGSAVWREIGMDLARQSFTDGDQAAAWLTNIALIVPANSPAETRALAGAWFELGNRLHYAPGFVRCRDLLKPLAAGNVDENVLLMLAMAEDQAHDAQAAADYRGVLAASTQPADTAAAAAANNLANLLLAQADAGGLAEAQTLANRAIALAGQSPIAQAYYMDTLGRVYLRKQQFDDAAGQFAKADEIIPNNPSILAGWADALVHGGKTSEAIVKLQAAESRMAGGGNPSPELVRELAQVRQAIGGATTKAL